MGNCFTFCRRINNDDDDDIYHQSSPACPALAKAGTSNIRASNPMEDSSGYSSPAHPAETGSNDTNLIISVISGSGSPSCLTSAEVTAATNSIAGDEDHYQSSPNPSGCHSPASPTLAKAGTSNIRASNPMEDSSGYSSPVHPAETGSNDTNLSIGVISGSGSPSCLTSAEVTAATNSIAGDEDHYQSSPNPSGCHSPACPALAKAGTSNIRASNPMEDSSGYSSPVHPAETGSNDTNLIISVISGSGSPSCLTSAEVTAATNSIAGDEDHYQSSPNPLGCHSPACPALAKAGTSNIRASNLMEDSSGYSSPVHPAETGSNDTNLSIGVISGSGSPSCLTSAEVTAATNSIAGDEDHYQSSPNPSGCHSPACPALAKAGTSNIRASNPMEDSSGYSSPAHPAETGSNDTNLIISVISGSGSPSCLTSAEVTAATNSIAGDEDHYQSSPNPSGCHNPASPTLAKAGTTISTSSITEVHSQPAAHCSPACPDEDGTANTNLGTECVLSGPCIPSHPGTPDTALSMASVFSGTSNSETESTGDDSTAPSEDVRITLSSFTLHCELGEGSFGKVVLATHRKSQQKVAIKSVIKTRNTYDLDIERYAMEKSQGCPFLIQLYAAFQTPLTACFVMEYASEGSLRDFIWKYSPVDSDYIQFLVAEISCGLEFLHYNGILHRDLKPDNILMDEEGHVRIADYGLAVAGLWDDERSTGVAGTRGFMAPEVVNNDYYQFEPDWFSLGVIIYILATKHMPFGSMTFDEYRREVNFSYPDYPPDMDPDLEDFIKGLLCKYPEERLGISEDIRSHIYMESIDWEEVEKGNAFPPFQVDMQMDMDIDNRLSPSAIMPNTSKKPGEEIYLPEFTYINSMWARM
ncbi:protein kinase C-like [Rana temporaria]|uniref:protein kinase C-like n=1 Tax=Rana temporaria TaxID=8407 RepID=UPI001AAD5387|nr:protein kinase C-like [Rana temporaria]